MAIEGKRRKQRTDKVNESSHDRNKLYVEPRYAKHLDRMVELVLQGYRSNEIFADVVSVDPELPEHQFATMMTNAYEQAKVTLHRDREYVFQLHMDRFERIYKDAMVMEDFDGLPLNPRKHWTLMLGKYREAMQALKAKEQLLGLHDKNVVIDVTTTSATLVDDGSFSDRNNIQKLTLEERIELLSLLQRSRTVSIEGVRQLVVKKTVVQVTEGGREKLEQQTILRPGEVIEDVTYEELPDKVVDRLKDVSQLDADPGEVEFRGPIVEDLVGKVEQGRTVQQIEQKIQSELVEKFEKLMRRVKNKKQT